MPGEPFVTVCLSGEPGFKARHRARVAFTQNRTPYVQTYSDRATLLYEADLKAEGVKAMAGRPPLDEPLIALFEIVRAIPASFSRRKREDALAMLVMPATKPDWDNHAKVSDALNGIVWTDDSRIVSSSVLKTYGEYPMWRVTVWRWLDGRLPTDPAEQIDMPMDA